MNDLNSVVDACLDVWNETDAAARREKIKALWAENGVYTDPLASVSGWDGLDRLVAGAQAQFQGLSFARGETLDEHHNIARFTWNLAPSPDTEAVAIGFDVLVLGADGKVEGVYGFIDRMPASAGTSR